jgi:hypothetical protein
MHGCMHIYNKLNTVPEHRVHSILYRSRTVFQMFQNSKWNSLRVSRRQFIVVFRKNNNSCEQAKYDYEVFKVIIE